jgi:hypothetical protein
MRRREALRNREEERLRLGYEIKTGVRFAERDGRPLFRTARLLIGGQLLAELLKDLLQQIMSGTMEPSPVEIPRAEHLARILKKQTCCRQIKFSIWSLGSEAPPR